MLYSGYPLKNGGNILRNQLKQNNFLLFFNYHKHGQQYGRFKQLYLDQRKYTAGCTNQEHPVNVYDDREQYIKPQEGLLGDVRVVLVGPQNPVNVGAVARLCANFEALDLVVVNPECDMKDKSIQIVGRNELSANIKQFNSLKDALDQYIVSVAFTRRIGRTKLGYETCYSSIRQLVKQVPQIISNQGRSNQAEVQQGIVNDASIQPQLDDGEGFGTALVFGREDSGLTQAEVCHCTHICGIPTGKTQPSMNLSHAVAVALSNIYEMRIECAQQKQNMEKQQKQAERKSCRTPGQIVPASAKQVQVISQKWKRAQGLLLQNPKYEGLLKFQSEVKLYKSPADRLDQVLQRANLTAREVGALNLLVNMVNDALDELAEMGGKSVTPQSQKV